MPQDELWACSARSTGLFLKFQELAMDPDNQVQLSAVPQWSKNPSGRTGYTNLLIPSYMRQDLPEVCQKIVAAYLWSDPKHLPACAQAIFQDVKQGYREGARG